MKQKQHGWMLCSVLTLFSIMMGTLSVGATAGTLSEGETLFLCLSTGNPDVPGDGVVVNSAASIPFFDIQPLFPIAGITDGITISLFTPTIPVQNVVVHFTPNGTRGAPCGFGYAKGPLLSTPIINGVQGFAESFSREELLGLLGDVKQNFPFCSDLTLDDYALESVIVYSGITPDFQAIYIREIDALALGIGENVFPTATTPVQCAPEVLDVVIDIKPGEFPNSINPNNKGQIPVGILTTDTFDATTVDPLSVEFGPNGATEAHGRGHIEDANGDGKPDLILHFNTQETGIQCRDTSASLTGQTFSGQEIEGTDAITTVGCR
jgi:hypothetical protein